MGFDPGGGADPDNSTLELNSSGQLRIKDSGVSSAKIADGAVVNADVNTSAGIALSKLASGTANRLLGNDGSGVPSEVTLGSNLQLSGGTLNVTGLSTSLPIVASGSGQLAGSSALSTVFSISIPAATFAANDVIMVDITHDGTSAGGQVNQHEVQISGSGITTQTLYTMNNSPVSAMTVGFIRLVISNSSTNNQYVSSIAFAQGVTGASTAGTASSGANADTGKANWKTGAFTLDIRARNNGSSAATYHIAKVYKVAA